MTKYDLRLQLENELQNLNVQLHRHNCMKKDAQRELTTIEEQIEMINQKIKETKNTIKELKL